MVLKLFLILSLSLSLYSFQIAPSTVDLRSLSLIVSEELKKNILLSSDLKNINVDVYFPNNISNRVLFEFYKKVIISKGLYLNRYDGFYMVEKAKRKFPVKVSNSNIQLDITVIELDNNKFKELGFNATVDGAAQGAFKIGNLFTSTTVFGSGAFLNIRSVLKALETDNIVNVVSSPTVLVKNKQTSTMIIGDTVSVLTSSISADNEDDKVRNTYVQQDIGLKISATPTLLKNGEIDVSVSINLENLKDYVDGLVSTSKRSLNSNFTIRSGDTIKVGGLIQKYELKKTSRVPVLGYIPILQYLFSYESEDEIDNTLSILIKVTEL